MTHVDENREHAQQCLPNCTQGHKAFLRHPAASFYFSHVCAEPEVPAVVHGYLV